MLACNLRLILTFKMFEFIEFRLQAQSFESDTDSRGLMSAAKLFRSRENGNLRVKSTHVRQFDFDIGAV